MFKLNVTRSIIGTVFAAGALLVLTATPSLAGGPPETINEADKYIDQLARDVYVPGHAKQANQALQEACTKYYKMKQSSLTDDWGSVYNHCRRALKTMRDYNTGGLPDWSPPVATKVSRIDVPSDDDQLAVVPPVVIDPPHGHLHGGYRDGLKNRDFHKDVARKDDVVRKDVAKKDTPAASHAGRLKSDTVGSAHAKAAKSPSVRTVRPSRATGLPHASRVIPSRPGHFGGMHVSPFRGLGGTHLAHLGGMHFGRR